MKPEKKSSTSAPPTQQNAVVLKDEHSPKNSDGRRQLSWEQMLALASLNGRQYYELTRVKLPIILLFLELRGFAELLFGRFWRLWGLLGAFLAALGDLLRWS